MAIKGYGNLVMERAEDGSLFVDRLSQLQFSVDVQNRDVDGYPFDNPDGLLQIVDSFITRETFDVQVTTGSFDKLVMQRVFDQLAQSSNVTLPHSEKKVVGVSPAEISITGLVADQQVGVFIESDTNPIALTQTTSAPATANEFQVATDKIVFEASRAGASVIVNYHKAYTAIESLGVTNNPVGEIGFAGRLIGPRFAVGPLFYIPKMSRISGFQFGGENSQITYRATAKAGFAKPIIFAFDVPLAA